MSKKMSQPTVKRFKIIDLVKAETNVRIEYPEEDMNTLRTSISQIGLQQMPRCTPEGEVYAGWGRVKACKNEGFEDIYCVVVDGLTSKEQIIASLSENTARKKLFDDELRYTLKRLRDDEGMTHKQIAEVTGLAESLISVALSFYRLPDETIEYAEGKAEDIRRWVVPEITQIVDAQEEGDKVAAGKLAVDIATTRSPLGKRVPRETLQEIAQKAKMGRGNPTDLQRILEEAQKKEYMTISLTMPDDSYKPMLKYSRLKTLTLQESVVESVYYFIEHVVDKFLQSK